jgi:AbrB family looped-hinge helix DNA binding protein
MSTDATLTSKGQTTIPKEIRDSLRTKEGDRMTFVLEQITRGLANTPAAYCELMSGKTCGKALVELDV